MVVKVVVVRGRCGLKYVIGCEKGFDSILYVMSIVLVQLHF